MCDRLVSFHGRTSRLDNIHKYLIFANSTCLANTSTDVIFIIIELEDDLLSRSRIIVLDSKVVCFPREIRVSFEQCRTPMRQVLKNRFFMFFFCFNKPKHEANRQ